MAASFEQIAYNFAAGEKRAKELDSSTLHYAIDDLMKTIEVQEQNNREGYHCPKLGYYWDELHTFSKELRERRKS